MREYSEAKVSSSLIGVAAGVAKWEGTSFFPHLLRMARLYVPTWLLGDYHNYGRS